MDQAVTHLVDEPELLRQARWGNREAFAELYARHAGAVHALALRLTADPATAQDLTHDAFVKMLRFIGGVRSDRPLRPWLKKVVANAAIDRLRHEHPHLYADTGDEGPDSEAWAGPVKDPAAHAEASALLQRLPPQARTVVWLHEVEGWSHTELAERFGHTPSWSKSVLSRALNRLRETLDEVPDDAPDTSPPLRTHRHRHER
ncbi:RNA polymerase sigma factor [Marilutibacter alkalisoli]|uniref:Sigma-70 family RNA polymerase sigma factor n=1 Tax=Marilutibacter alkalisoli TaxID=2591633 RepID=A0A514BPP1_9GAMM|nr:sigma-70 family RNA polymerase sigma factor [Lysobacter alkalisoli]QDH69352.1 sigma-70 family RNA polymerase sigma factor [Lysobacter alkalisoli]